MLWKCSKLHCDQGRFTEGESKEFFKKQTVIELIFQFRIGVNVEPLLEQLAFIESPRRSGVSAFAGSSQGIMAQ